MILVALVISLFIVIIVIAIILILIMIMIKNIGDYLEGHGDLVSKLIMGITGFITWLIGVINLLTKSP